MNITEALILFLIWLSGVASGLLYSMSIADKITRQIIKKYFNKTL